MKRREVVLRLGSLILVIPASRAISACGTTSTASSAPSTNFVAFTSSVTSSHSHTVKFPVSSFQNPPSGGDQETTSDAVDPTNEVNHHHVVALSESELAAVQSGQTVVKQTSTDNGHLHQFSIRLSGTTPSPNPTPAPYGA